MLSDKVYIVAGGGQGLGEATAIELGSHGATVVVNDLGVSVSGEGESAEPAEETVSDVKAAGGDGSAHFGDISSFEYTEKLVEDTVAEYGKVDGVINFAGILRDSISYKMDEDQWDDVVQVHLKGHFSLLRNTAAHWREVAREEGGELDSQRSIVTVTSRAGMGSVGQINYASSKAGILGMTRTAARELFRYNIRVNSLMPTAFTRMIEEIPEEKRSFSEDDMPPEYVAPVAAYLLSDDAEDITGCTVRANGEEIGLISDPQPVRLGYQEGGWELEDIVENFRDGILSGVDLTQTERQF